MNHNLRLALFAGILLINASQANATSYTFTNLGYGEAHAINNVGQAAGSSFDYNSSAPSGTTWYSTATVWNGTTATSLGTGYANAINNAGQVAGVSRQVVKFDFDSYSIITATVWNGTTATNLDSGHQYGYLNSGQAFSINNVGQVAGASFSNGNSIATVWNGTTVTNLGIGYAKAINDVGQVAGYSFDSNGNPIATVWNGTTATSLGTGYANAINNAGQVAGYSVDSDGSSAIVWNGTTATILDKLSGGSHSYSRAYAINKAGQVVGASNYPGKSTATLWNGTTATDLNSFLNASEISAGWVLESAYGINDSGSIVGQAFNTKTGAPVAFLLSASGSVSAVPEPETYTMLLAGLGLMGFIARRRKA